MNAQTSFAIPASYTPIPQQKSTVYVIVADAGKLRSFSANDVALSTDLKGKTKPEKQKSTAVDFSFPLVVPAQGTSGDLLNLDFGSVSAGAVVLHTTGDTLATFSGKKVVINFNPPLDSATVVDVIGRGTKGKLMKAKSAWGINKKNAVDTYTYNILRLPFPNLWNWVQDMYSGGGFGASGLVAGA
jgi:hypothetical protein